MTTAKGSSAAQNGQSDSRQPLPRRPVSRSVSVFVATMCLLIGWLGGRREALQELHIAVDWPVTIEAATKIVQAGAYIAAGIWTYLLFVRQRVGHARAEIGHQLTVVRLDDGRRLVRVIAEIKNVGSVLIQPPSAWVVLRRFSPDGQATWQDIERRDLETADERLVIEPGEVERYPVDFVVGADIDIVEVHSRVWCGKHYAEQYWDETSVHRLPKE